MSQNNYLREYNYDIEFDEDKISRPYAPSLQILTINPSARRDNPIIFLEVWTNGGRKLRNGNITLKENIGRLYFELRKDICPVACENFLTLIKGTRGIDKDGVRYQYKGCKIFRVIKNLLFQSGDLMNDNGNCSRSIFNSSNGGLFRDENFLLRHTGPGCISYCNRGPDTNGSLFQVCFTRNTDLDGDYVVFGCLASDESYACLSRINEYGTAYGQPLEVLTIADCGQVYPIEKQNKL